MSPVLWAHGEQTTRIAFRCINFQWLFYEPFLCLLWSFCSSRIIDQRPVSKAEHTAAIFVGIWLAQGFPAWGSPSTLPCPLQNCPFAYWKVVHTVAVMIRWKLTTTQDCGVLSATKKWRSDIDNIFFNQTRLLSRLGVAHILNLVTIG